MHATSRNITIAHAAISIDFKCQVRDAINCFQSHLSRKFCDIPDLQTILSLMQEIPVSERTVERRIMQMAENVTAKQNSGLQEIVAFSIAVDENTDMNDVERPTVIAQYCDKD
ncbi:hypothetical protein TNCV_3739471 [Trichonephila clavipes]|nr:hypothetical protein TNCV_3739471 [Trichonephila clavipes]